MTALTDDYSHSLGAGRSESSNLVAISTIQQLIWRDLTRIQRVSAGLLNKLDKGQKNRQACIVQFSDHTPEWLQWLHERQVFKLGEPVWPGLV
jgi:hypothetical protein